MTESQVRKHLETAYNDTGEYMQCFIVWMVEKEVDIIDGEIHYFKKDVDTFFDILYHIKVNPW